MKRRFLIALPIILALLLALAAALLLRGDDEQALSILWLTP